jgi:anti-sigma factor RsiW
VSRKTPDTGCRLPAARQIDCEQAEVLVSRRLDGELSDADARVLNAHLATCAECRAVLESWSRQDDCVEESLTRLFASKQSRNDVTEARPLIPRRFVWVPMSLAASQVLALTGLTIYFLFFGSPASAPQSAVVPRGPIATRDTSTTPPVAPVVARIEEKMPAPLARVAEPPALVTTLTPARVAEEPVSQAVLGATETVQVPALVEFVLATPQQGLAAPRELDNVQLVFTIHADGDSLEQNGRIVLLGDILNGRGIVRIVEQNGRKRDVFQQDVNSLSAPLREIVESFLQNCARPEFRQRLAAAQKSAAPPAHTRK